MSLSAAGEKRLYERPKMHRAVTKFGAVLGPSLFIKSCRYLRNTKPQPVPPVPASGTCKTRFDTLNSWRKLNPSPPSLPGGEHGHCET